MVRHRILVLAATLAVAATGVVAGPAQAAAPNPIPSDRACSVDVDGQTYACLNAADRTVAAGQVATFTGALGAQAVRNLRQWTAGENSVCLTRYRMRPDANGSWPWQTLGNACTTVRKDGRFTLHVSLGRPGAFFYGLEMGTCQGSADLCGNGDPGLLGVGGRRAVQVTTT